MLLRIGSQAAAWMDFEAQVDWTATVSRQFGEMTFSILRDSPAWDPEIIDERGGFLVEAHTRYGIWQGVADSPEYSPSGMQITARHVNNWTSIRLVGKRTFYAYPAGVIAGWAIRDGLLGLGTMPVTLGQILAAPPLIPFYEFARQPVLDVLTELSEQTGQEWAFDADLRFHWVSRQGTYREGSILDDGQLFQRLRIGGLDETAAEVIEVDQDGREFTARNDSAPAGWRSQRLERI